MKVHATGMLANVADPAVVELRYDTSLFTGPGAPPADPAALDVGHADGPDAPYRTSRRARAGACRWARSPASTGWPSRTRTARVVMVVRTTDTSRWIAH